MRSAPAIAVLAFLATACVTAAPAALPPAGPPALVRAIDEVLAAPAVSRAAWGVVVEDESGRVLYARNADVLMMPASTRKLFTAAAIADCEPLGATIPTTFLLRGRVSDGVLHGDLVVRGDGDPSLGGRHFAVARLQFAPLFDALRARGIRRIAGDVVADVSRFASDTVPGSWKVDNLPHAYAAPADALAYHENAVALVIDRSSCPDPAVAPDPPFVRVDESLECGDSFAVVYGSDRTNTIFLDGTVVPVAGAPLVTRFPAVGDPALFTAQAVRALVAESGIEIAGRARASREPLAGERLAVVHSPPMSELLAVLLKNSQNLYAEMLLKRTVASNGVSYADALAAERAFLEAAVGLERGEFAFGDASGLSPENLVTPRAVTRLLRYMHAAPRRGVFDALLARPGEEGTLERRLPEFGERLRGKTGSIDQVSALSGWVVTDAGEVRFFAIMVNHHAGASSVTRNAIDSIVAAVARR